MKSIKQIPNKRNYLESISEESLLQSNSLHQERCVIPKRQNSQIPQQTYLSRNDRGMTQLRRQYPSKILQNCQRTVRVILITQLDKKILSKKSIKQKLYQILSQFIPNNRILSSDDEDFERNSNRNYYHSVNYSRVKMGQKIFQKKILLNPFFKDQFFQIFQNKDLDKSDKPRKNERSKITFEERKVILKRILEINRINFQNYIKTVNMTHESSNTQQEQILFQEKQQSQIEAIQVQAQQQFCLLQKKLPFIPIPLSPNQYNQYMKNNSYF